MKLNLGIVATGISGSAAGVTGSRNRFGWYLRARTPPVNPNSSRQMFARAVFTYVAGLWSSLLTQAQRDAWDQYADAIVWKGSLGLDCKLTGYNHFVRSNTAIFHANAAGDLVPDGPVILTMPGSDPTFVCTVDEAGQEISVAYDNSLGWANETGGYLLVEMSSPKGVGRTFIGGPFRKAGAVVGVTGTPPTSPEVFDVPFSVAELQKVDCVARIIMADGRVSTPFQHTSSVVS